MMKRRIIAATLLIFMLAGLFGCVPSNDGKDSTAPEKTDEPAGTSLSDTSEQQKDQSDETQYFVSRKNEGGYTYILYNIDGSVAEEIDFCEDEPFYELLEGSISKITVGNETYYYDLESRKFSESFYDVFDENGHIIVMAAEEKLLVRDAFDADGFYKELDRFTYALSDNDPFVSASFSDDGQSVCCVYLSGDDREERTECFNITDGTKFVKIDDWRNQKELLSGDEKASVEAFLYGYMGKIDYNTGFEYDYDVTGGLTVNGIRYYHCECYYLMVTEGSEEKKRVPAAEFLMSEDHSERYDCRETDGSLVIYTENNMM